VVVPERVVRMVNCGVVMLDLLVLPARAVEVDLCLGGGGHGTGRRLMQASCRQRTRDWATALIGLTS
jgi:hypothetical protein